MWHVVVAIITSVIFALAFHFIPRLLSWVGMIWIKWEDDLIVKGSTNPIFLIFIIVLIILLGALIDVFFVDIISKKKKKNDEE
jgi:hypothetical protein